MNLKYLLLFISAILVSSHAKASDTLALASYLDIISKNYPLIKKADLFEEFTEAYDLKGKGVFDPKVASSFDSKQFSDANYFNIWQTEAKIPTSLPIDFSVGYERNNGEFLNGEYSVPQNGLLYGTINLSLLRGLMFDEQRFSLKMAELNGIKGQIERDLLTREILYQAIATYFDWSAAYMKNRILSDYLAAIQIRHLNIIELYVNGDKPAIDTVESRINLNTANKILLEAKQSLMMKRQKVALFLWDEDGNPLEIRSAVLPQVLEDAVEEVRALTLIEDPEFNRDPLIRKLENEISQIEFRNRLEKENLKPQLDLKYNTIVNMGKDDFDPSFSLNDYKYGVKLEVPILNRKTKGEMLLNDIMIQQKELDKDQYGQNLRNKFEALSQSQEMQNNIIEVVNEKIDNSEVLYEAELLKFDLGESSVFMLNSRERKLLDARVDLVKSYLKYGKTISELYYLKLGQE